MSLEVPGKAAIAGWAAALVAAAALSAPALARASIGPVLTGSVSDSTTLPTVDSVAVAGNYAYVTDYYAGRLSAIDISLPSSPFIAGSSASSSGLMNGSTVNVAGGYAFVASKNRNGPQGSESNDDGTGNSLTILDIHTNPAEPQIVGTVHDVDSLFGAYGIAVSGNYAYTASQGCIEGQPCPKAVGHAFDVIEIAGPEAPRIVATLSGGKEPQAYGHITSVAISGHYAYLTAAYQDRLTVIDIANPLSPKLVASLYDPTHFDFPVDVATSGNYAYVICQQGEGPLTVVDISDPAEPKVVGSLSSPALSGGYRIRVRGAMAYISASENEGIAVVDISSPASPRLLASYTDPSHLHSTTGLALDETGEHLVATSTYLPGQHKATFPPYPLEPEGPEQDGTVSVITLDPDPIEAAIGAGPAESTTQTSASFGFSVNDAVATVQCRLDGGPWGQCSTPTSQAYANLSPGPHEFQVQATDSAGTADTDAYSWAIAAPPANSEPPAIAGNAVKDETLSASPGAWSGYPTPSLAYQWQRCDQTGAKCTPIAGATTPTYTLTATDVASTIEVTLTATSSAGSASATSQTSAVVGATPAAATAPNISGNAIEGQTLTASPGTWSGYPTPALTYQWERCNSSSQSCVAITGANSPNYTAVSADVGETLLVVVTGTNVHGWSAAESAPTAVLTAPAVGGSSGGPNPGGPNPGGTNPDGGGSLGSNVGEGVLGATQTTPGKPEIQAALVGALTPHGNAGRISSVNRHRGYQVVFDAPAGGEVTISWYEPAKGAHRAGAKPVLVASGRASALTKAALKLTVKLTTRGKRLLEHGHRIRLIGRGSFTLKGGSPVTVVKPFTLR